MTGALLAAESPVGPTLALIIGVGAAAQWLAWRTQVPSIVLLLAAGLILGPATGAVDPDALLGDTLFPLVSLAVAMILFEGGLDLPPSELRATGTVVRRLISIGALVTFAVAAWSATWLFDIGPETASVMGAVLIVTGPTVVGPLLRFVRPSGPTGRMLRAEGILIDPIGATAALLAFEVALREEPGEAVTSVLGVIALTLAAGVGLGLLLGWLLGLALHRFLVPDHLVNPIALAVVVVGFVVCNEIQEEAGLLTVTVMGIWLARQSSAVVRRMLEFQESLRTLLISTLFLLLAARIDAADLRDLALPSLAFLAILVLVARPLSVLVSTARTTLSWRERVFLMSVAPRGIVAAAVSSVFALRLEEVGVEDAQTIVPVVFLVIIGTILVYGFLAGPLANLLGVAESDASGVLIVGAHPTARELARELMAQSVPVVVVDTDAYNVWRAASSKIPARRLNVLAPETEHVLDLRGIGRLLAMTSNDEVNTLATARYARMFGRSGTYQLAPTVKPVGEAVPAELLGRVVPIDFRTMDERMRDGWHVVTVPVDETTAEEIGSERLLPIAVVADDRVEIVSGDTTAPRRGAVIGLSRSTPDGQASQA